MPLPTSGPSEASESVATEEPVVEATEEPANPGESALEIAAAWLASSGDDLAAAVAEAVKESPELAEHLEVVPSLLRSAASALLVASLNVQVEEGLAFEVSVAVPLSGGDFVVTASTIFTGEIDLPALGNTNYAAHVPVDITVDVAERTVSNWALGTVRLEIGPGSE